MDVIITSVAILDAVVILYLIYTKLIKKGDGKDE